MEEYLIETVALEDTLAQSNRDRYVREYVCLYTCLSLIPGIFDLKSDVVFRIRKVLGKETYTETEQGKDYYVWEDKDGKWVAYVDKEGTIEFHIPNTYLSNREGMAAWRDFLTKLGIKEDVQKLARKYKIGPYRKAQPA